MIRAEEQSPLPRYPDRDQAKSPLASPAFSLHSEDEREIVLQGNWVEASRYYVQQLTSGSDLGDALPNLFGHYQKSIAESPVPKIQHPQQEQPTGTPNSIQHIGKMSKWSCLESSRYSNIVVGLAAGMVPGAQRVAVRTVSSSSAVQAKTWSQVKQLLPPLSQMWNPPTSATVALMRMAVGAGHWRDAVELSTRVPSATLDVRTSAIRAYASVNQWEKALALLLATSPLQQGEEELAATIKVMTMAGPASVSWCHSLAAVQAFAGARVPKCGEDETTSELDQTAEKDADSTTTVVRDSGASPVRMTSPVPLNNCLHALAQSGRWKESIALVAKAKDDAYCDFNSATLSVMCRAFGHRKYGFLGWWHALHLITASYVDLNNRGSGVDATARNHLMGYCLTHRHWRGALSLHQGTRSLDGENTDPRHIHGLVLQLARAGQVHTGHMLLDQHVRPFYLARQSKNQHQPEGDAHQPVEVTVATREIEVPKEEGRTKASSLVSSQRTSHGGHVSKYEHALNLLLRNSTTQQDIQAMVMALKKDGIALDRESREHLIQHTSAQGYWESALGSLEDLVKSEVGHRAWSSSARSNTSVISTATHDMLQFAINKGRSVEEDGDFHAPGSWVVGLRLYTAMDHLGVGVSDISFKAVVAACLKADQEEKAQEVLGFMMRRGLTRRS